MHNKLLKAILFYCVALGIGVVIQSCCRNKEMKICDISFSSSYNGNDFNSEDGIDTSYNQFRFEIIGNLIEENSVCKAFLPFLNSAYAFQPCLPRINDDIPRENLSLSLNRDITFNGNLISAGSNLMSDASIASAIDYDAYPDQVFIGQISMDSANYSKLLIDTGYYQVTLNAQSTSGASSVQSRSVLFKEY